VSTMFGGGSDDAGFVQVMEGTVKDRAKAEAWETPELLAWLQAARPDLLGGVRVWFPDGSYVGAAYFTNEDDARKGEASSDFTGPQEEYTELFGDITFIDLPKPAADLTAVPSGSLCLVVRRAWRWRRVRQTSGTR
jgi:hypothetical protein